MILKYILYGSIWSKFGAKISKSRKNVPQIPNVLTEIQPTTTKYKCNTFCDLSQQKCAQKPRQYIGDFLNFFHTYIIAATFIFIQQFFKFTSQIFLTKLAN
jgi:hypothetical protein